MSLSREEAEASVFPAAIVDQLHIDFRIASENRQTGLFSASGHLFADAISDFLSFY